MDKENASRIALEEAKNAVIPALLKSFGSTSKGFGENKQTVLNVALFPLIKSATPYCIMACQCLKRKINTLIYSGIQRCSCRVNRTNFISLSILSVFTSLAFTFYGSIVSFWNSVTSLLSNLLPQLPESPSPSGSPSGSRSQGQNSPFKPSRLPCPRLPNIGSTCFFNSTLQVLLTVKDKLLSHFEQAKTGCVHVIKYQNNTKSIEVTVTFAERPMISAFLEFLQAVKAEKNIDTTLRQLHFRIGERYKRFSSFNQQDSEEVLRCLLDGIRMEEIEAVREEITSKLKGYTAEESENDLILRDCLRATFKLKTLVDKIFGGSCVNTVICRECFHPLQLIEPFLDLSVPMPDRIEPVSPSTETPKNASTCPILLQQHLRAQDRNMFTCLEINAAFSPSLDSLEHCLKLFTSLDVLDEDNKFICDHCTDELKKKQQEGSSDNKDYAECLVSKQLLIHELPPILVLHMKRFHLGLRVTKNDNHTDFPDTLNVSSFCTDIPRGAMEYDLYGVVQHSGSLQGGHYVAYVKYEEVKNTAKDRVEEADGGKSGYTTRTAENYGYWTVKEMHGNEGSFSSTAKSSDKYGDHYQAEAYEVAELGYQNSDENANRRAEKKDIWCYTSDSHISLSKETEVHNSQAYLLLYVQRN